MVLVAFLLLASAVFFTLAALVEQHVPERVFDWLYKQVTR
jgi:hypothetical protein